MFIDEIFHFTLSTIAGLAVGYFTQNYYAIIFALLSGFFIDADHFIDYFSYTKFRRFSLREFKSSMYFEYAGKVYILFHGFEYSILFVILGIVYPQLGWLFYSFGISNLLHLIYDTVYNKPIWPTYFLSFRIAKKFDHKTFDFKK